MNPTDLPDQTQMFGIKPEENLKIRYVNFDENSKTFNDYFRASVMFFLLTFLGDP